jgi:hypothetical protein
MSKQKLPIVEMHSSVMQSCVKHWVIVPFYITPARQIHVGIHGRVSIADMYCSRKPISTDTSVAVTEQCIEKAKG